MSKTRIVSTPVLKQYGRQKIDKVAPTTDSDGVAVGDIYGSKVSGSAPSNAVKIRKGRR